MKRIVAITAILEDPKKTQQEFNTIVSAFKGIVKGRLGLPLDSEGVAVVSLVVVGSLDEINDLTGKLGNLPDVQVNTAISKKKI